MDHMLKYICYGLLCVLPWQTETAIYHSDANNNEAEISTTVTTSEESTDCTNTYAVELTGTVSGDRQIHITSITYSHYDESHGSSFEKPTCSKNVTCGDLNIHSFYLNCSNRLDREIDCSTFVENLTNCTESSNTVQVVFDLPVCIHPLENETTTSSAVGSSQMTETATPVPTMNDDLCENTAIEITPNSTFHVTCTGSQSTTDSTTASSAKMVATSNTNYTASNQTHSTDTYDKVSWVAGLAAGGGALILFAFVTLLFFCRSVPLKPSTRKSQAPRTAEEGGLSKMTSTANSSNSNGVSTGRYSVLPVPTDQVVSRHQSATVCSEPGSNISNTMESKHTSQPQRPALKPSNEIRTAKEGHVSDRSHLAKEDYDKVKLPNIDRPDSKPHISDDDHYNTLYGISHKQRQETGLNETDMSLQDGHPVKQDYDKVKRPQIDRPQSKPDISDDDHYNTLYDTSHKQRQEMGSIETDTSLQNGHPVISMQDPNAGNERRKPALPPKPKTSVKSKLVNQTPGNSGDSSNVPEKAPETLCDVADDTTSRELTDMRTSSDSEKIARNGEEMGAQVNPTHPEMELVENDLYLSYDAVDTA